MIAVAKKTKEASDPRLTRLALTASEFLALDHIGRKYAHRTRSSSLRFAMEQQLHRDRGFGTDSRDPSDPEAVSRLVQVPGAVGYLKLATKVKAELGINAIREAEKEGADVGLREWSVWLWPEHSAYLEKIMAAWGLESRVDGFRMAIRTQAELDGFKPKDGWL